MGQCKNAAANGCNGGATQNATVNDYDGGATQNAAANCHDGGRDASTTASDYDPYGHLKLLGHRPSGCAGAVILAPLLFSTSTGFRGSL